MAQDKELIARLETEIKAHDAELDKIADQRTALIAQAVKIMEVRNQKIAQLSLHIRENPTPIVGLPNQERIQRLRVQAGVAMVGVGK